MSALSEVSNKLRALVGTIIHSVSFGNLQVVPRGALVYNAAGTIQRIIDLTGFAPDAVFQGNQGPFEGIEEVKDFGSKLIIPGFVDAHCHAPQVCIYKCYLFPFIILIQLYILSLEYIFRFLVCVYWHRNGPAAPAVARDLHFPL